MALCSVFPLLNCVPWHRPASVGRKRFLPFVTKAFSPSHVPKQLLACNQGRALFYFAQWSPVVSSVALGSESE